MVSSVVAYTWPSAAAGVRACCSSSAIDRFLADGLLEASPDGCLALTRRVPPHPVLVRALGVLAVACHSVVAASALGDLGEMSLGISASASLVSWLVVILLLLASLFKPVLSAAVALFPIAAATILLATELPVGSHRAELTPGIMIHILTSIVAFAVFGDLLPTDTNGATDVYVSFG